MLYLIFAFVSLAVVSFMMIFFVALCRDSGRSRICHVMRVDPPEPRGEIETPEKTADQTRTGDIGEWRHADHALTRMKSGF
jgi:hypothetical protein